MRQGVWVFTNTSCYESIFHLFSVELHIWKRGVNWLLRIHKKWLTAVCSLHIKLQPISCFYIMEMLVKFNQIVQRFTHNNSESHMPSECGMWLLVNSQISSAATLKSGTGYVPLSWANGNSVVIQWQFSVPGIQTPEYTGTPLVKELLVASVFPVCFQWSSSGFPVVFQCVPIMQINPRLPLGHHWVLASENVVPVASQCTCDSSGLPVR